MSGIQVLSIETLKDYDDGLLAAAFMANLRAVIADLNERPSDDRARKLSLEMAFVPSAHGGDLDRVNIEYKVKHNIGGHEGREQILTPKIMDKKMNLVFASTGTDARQPGLPMDD